jgi:hypothetical protein
VADIDGVPQKWDEGVGEAAGVNVVELMTSDADDLDALYAELRGVPGITMEAQADSVVPGELGAAVELLTVALSGGAITAFLQIIKTLLDSRGPAFVLKMRRGKNRLEIAADNIDEALPLIKEIMGGP